MRDEIGTAAIGEDRQIGADRATVSAAEFMAYGAGCFEGSPTAARIARERCHGRQIFVDHFLPVRVDPGVEDSYGAIRNETRAVICQRGAVSRIDLREDRRSRFDAIEQGLRPG